MLTDEMIREAMVATLNAQGHPTPDTMVDWLFPLVQTTVNVVRDDIAREIEKMPVDDMTPEEVRGMAASIAVARL